MEYKAFKDLTKEERSEIVEAMVSEKCIELSLVEGGAHTKWVDHPQYICPYDVYRIKPAKKLDIPWEIIKPEYKWAAMDDSGELMVYVDKPTRSSDGFWMTGVGCKWNDISSLDIDTTGISWENSLTQRPEGI